MDKQLFEFNKALLQCPACFSEKIKDEAFYSKKGIMSLANFAHSFCEDCGSYFVNPQPTDESLEEFYNSKMEEDVNKLLEASIDRYNDPEKKSYFYNNRIKPLQKYINKPSNVLDVGCGTGVFVKFMLDEGHNATGIDLSLKSIEYGRNKLSLNNKLEIQNWEMLGKEEGIYDVITAWTLIEHLKNPLSFLCFSRRKLKEYGILLLEFPTVDSLLFEHTKENFFWVMPPYHLHLFSIKGMESLLKKAGYEILEEYRMPNNWNFISSLCKKLEIDIDSLLVNKKTQLLALEADKVFDNIAAKLNMSSSVQLICKKVSK